MGPAPDAEVLRPTRPRFSYVKYDDQAVAQQEAFKKAFEEIERFADYLKDGRSKSLLLTYLEIAYMWTGKAIRDEHIVRNDPGNPALHVPERSNQ